jgi:hypothetical protein
LLPFISSNPSTPLSSSSLTFRRTHRRNKDAI